MKNLLFGFLVCLLAASAKGQSAYHYRFGGDWIATSRVKALYTVSNFIADFGFPLEGVSGDGVNDRWDRSVADYQYLLQFPYGSLSDPPSFYLDKSFSAGTIVLDTTLPEISELFEVVAIDDPDGDLLEFRSVLPSGRSRSHFHFWMLDPIRHYATFRRFDAGSSMSLSGLATAGMGRLRWMVCDGSGQWWTSESAIDPGDPVLRFETTDTDGRWARLSGPRASLGAADLAFDEIKFSAIRGFGFGNFDNSFVEANESFVRFRRFDVEGVVYHEQMLRLQADLRLWVRGSRWSHDDVYHSPSIGGPRRYRIAYKKSARFRFSIQNDSEVSHQLRLWSRGISRRDRFTVIDSAGENQTARIRTGLTSSVVQPGEFLDFSGVKRRGPGSSRGRSEVTYALRAGVDVDSVLPEEIPIGRILSPDRVGAGGDHLAVRFFNARSKRGK